jgi:hypothetical protein
MIHYFSYPLSSFELLFIRYKIINFHNNSTQFYNSPVAFGAGLHYFLKNSMAVEIPPANIATAETVEGMESLPIPTVY